VAEQLLHARTGGDELEPFRGRLRRQHGEHLDERVAPFLDASGGRERKRHRGAQLGAPPRAALRHQPDRRAVPARGRGGRGLGGGGRRLGEQDDRRLVARVREALDVVGADPGSGATVRERGGDAFVRG
jgi:hypothetical protein